MFTSSEISSHGLENASTEEAATSISSPLNTQRDPDTHQSKLSSSSTMFEILTATRSAQIGDTSAVNTNHAMEDTIVAFLEVPFVVYPLLHPSVLAQD
jgi:hypothetical protein